MFLGVPNFSEGRDAGRVQMISDQFAAGSELIDSHSDAVHNRTVLNITAPPKFLGESLVRGAGACSMVIDMRRHEGAHPCIGALDVCPVVHTAPDEADGAKEVAADVAKAIAGADIPVFLYGELASSTERRERSYFRNGGLEALRERMRSGELVADFGPQEPHPTAGGTLVTARLPLAAFNLLLEGVDMDAASAIARELRESGGGLPGVRAIAVDLGEAGPQISTNVHDPIAVPLATVVARIAELAAPHDARLGAGEVVGLVPAAALEGFPDEVALPGFDPARHVIENLAA